jgi:16S rRNA (cytosine967-C5)-methyltransferase
MSDSGRVYSFDIHESKFSLVSDGTARLSLKSVAPRVLDATTPDAELFGTADKVICDVPCSGLGVLGKKPDLRYKSEESVAELPALQYEILSKSVNYLKVGGELLYSTCTLNPEENERVIERFLENNPDYCEVDFTVEGYASAGGMLTLLPHIHGCDGFFMAKIKKIR